MNLIFKMKMNLESLKKNKKALSGVVTAMIMIAIIMAAGVLIWLFTNNIVGNQLEEAESCFGIYDKVSINNDYTCYDSTSGEVWVSISVGDIEVSGILVGIAGSGSSRSETLSDEEQSISDVRYYHQSPGKVKAPGKNSGQTYVFSGFSSEPDSIEIAPIVSGKQCDVSGSVKEIYDCSLISD